MATIAQRSFAGGEICPALYARVDIVKYATGLRTCRNNYIRRHGGSANRPGTSYTCEVKDSSKRVKLIPFEFNSSQTYMLEFGNLYMRVIRNGAPVTVSGVAAYNGATAYVIGDLVVSSSINYYCIQAGTGQTPASSPTYWYPLTGAIYEIPTPYLEADLPTLNFIQSADVITLVHNNYAPRELARTGHTAWTLSVITFAPSITAPVNLAVSGTDGTADYWVVTSVHGVTFEESLEPTPVGSDTVASSGSPRTLTWDAVTGAGSYNVYKKTNGIFGFIGVAVGTSFVDNGIEADAEDTPPQARNPFSGSTNYPAVVAYYQQRLGFANTLADIQLAEFGRSAYFKNFTTSFPLQDDDSVRFALRGRQVNPIRAMIDVGKLIIFTASGEWIIQGDADGVMKPGAVNPTQKSYEGCSTLTPIIIGSSALFVQALGSVVRDLMEDIVEGYKGNDLSVFASHLFEGYTLTDWAYQKIPNSIVWAVRSDGVLLGFTYLREHQIWAWHRHDFTDGTVENVACIAEGLENVPYFVVKRTINGSTKRYIERMNTRLITDIRTAIFMDSALTYDGRNTSGSNTMTLSGGTTWENGETLTLTAFASTFVAGDVGNQIFLYDAAGDLIRFTITGYSSVTVVTGMSHKTVPLTLRATATLVWTKAVDEVSGLSHLEGKEVSILGDGLVVASPNNDAYTVRTVTSGAVTLDKPYGVIHVGLPITADLETLDIDTPTGQSIADQKKLIGQLTAYVEKTRGLFAGPKAPTDDATDPLEGLLEFKLRNEEGYDDPVELKTGVIDLKLETHWNSNGRVFIRQVDPLPCSILAVMPAGIIPFRA